MARRSDCRRISCKQTSSAAKPRHACAAPDCPSRLQLAFRLSRRFQSSPRALPWQVAARAVPPGFAREWAAALISPPALRPRQAMAAAEEAASAVQTEAAPRDCGACRRPRRPGGRGRQLGAPGDAREDRTDADRERRRAYARLWAWASPLTRRRLSIARPFTRRMARTRPAILRPTELPCVTKALGRLCGAPVPCFSCFWVQLTKRTFSMASTSDRGFTDDRDIDRRAAWILGVNAARAPPSSVRQGRSNC